MSESTQWTGDGLAEAACGSRGCGGDAPVAPDCHGATPSPAGTGSYLQVVVEKHRRKREDQKRPAATGTSVRLPTASSPNPLCPVDARDATWPHGAVLVACPASLAYYFGGAATAEVPDATANTAQPPQQLKKQKPWSLFREREPLPEDLLADSCDEDEVTGAGCDVGESSAEPACVEVYKFERVGSWLSCGAARPTHVGARASRAGRTARAVAAEIGAAARLAAGTPFLAVALALRCLLQTTRDATAALLLAFSDYGLKPALALAFNAVLHPPLVFLANLFRGVRAALRPALGVAMECASAAAVLVRAVRLVEINYYSSPAYVRTASAVTACPACDRTHKV